MQRYVFLGAKGNSIGLGPNRPTDADTARLEEAVAAYREALQEWTPERTPYYHDIAQRNLARALKLLDARKRG